MLQVARLRKSLRPRMQRPRRLSARPLQQGCMPPIMQPHGHCLVIMQAKSLWTIKRHLLPPKMPQTITRQRLLWEKVTTRQRRHILELPERAVNNSAHNKRWIVQRTSPRSRVGRVLSKAGRVALIPKKTAHRHRTGRRGRCRSAASSAAAWQQFRPLCMAGSDHVAGMLPRRLS